MDLSLKSASLNFCLNHWISPIYQRPLHNHCEVYKLLLALVSLLGSWVVSKYFPTNSGSWTAPKHNIPAVPVVVGWVCSYTILWNHGLILQNTSLVTLAISGLTNIPKIPLLHSNLVFIGYDSTAWQARSFVSRVIMLPFSIIFSK